MKRLLIVLLLVSHATVGKAVFDAQVLIGGANANSSAVSVNSQESKSVSGSQVGLSLHFDPVPSIPASIGLIYLNQGFAVEQEKNGSTSFGGVVVGPEIMAWVPTTSPIAPYAKVAYTIVGYGKKFEKLAHEDGSVGLQPDKKDSTLSYSGSGMRAAAGLNWAPFRYVSFMAEYSMTWSKVHASMLKDGETGETTKLEDTPTESLTTQGLLFGVGGNI